MSRRIPLERRVFVTAVSTHTAWSQRAATAMSGPTVELLYDAKGLVAEGPFYENETNLLIWVDIISKTVNFLDVTTRQNRSLQLDDAVGAVIPVAGSDTKLVALIGRKICILDRNTGSILKELETVDQDKPLNRFNDGKCDSEGRLWCGTMKFDEGHVGKPVMDGSLFCFSGGKLTTHITDVGISNGIDWSRDNSTMYYIDSIVRKVYSFDYNITEGTIANQKPFVDYAQDDKLGLPDGMCTDVDGKLWTAGFFGQSITCWDPVSGEKLQDVKIPALRITSCCFGGPNYEWLFVTSATFMAEDAEKEKFPHSGGLFVVKNLGTRGVAPNCFKL